MEDMARLALVEQSVRDIDKFSKLLHELRQHIKCILENPHDYQLRAIRSNALKDYCKLDPLIDYLKYVGFESVDGNFTYSSTLTLSNLRMAQVAIERKINLCCGGLDKNLIKAKPSALHTVVKNKLLPVHVLTTSNSFLLKVQDLFNNILMYEDPDLQAEARDVIPIVTLQLMALDRVREQQANIKKGLTKDNDLPFDIALLMELLIWFKYKFFKWVDNPDCGSCGSTTVPNGVTTMNAERETCRVELYRCVNCGSVVKFPRYNDVRKLLQTRRGRCGEWANCFTLLCRALGYDTRYVYDVTDHVWCEVFDYDSNTWLHADPCEAKLNAPLLYSHGWGKKLTYVFAFSMDDVQDVTWRYTMNHKEVLQRRNLCSEEELTDCIIKLRDARQKHVSEARRVYLAKRNLQELVQLMVEKKPSEYENQGRISGSIRWRTERGELGSKLESYTFSLNEPGLYHIRYHPSTDKYTVSRDGVEISVMSGWSSGVYTADNIFRKVERDWKKVYLAREEGSPKGNVSWRIDTGGKCIGVFMGISITTAVYEDAKIAWKLTFDKNPPVLAQLSEQESTYERQFRTVQLQCELSGGAGDVAWQHAQLFRRSIEDETSALHFLGMTNLIDVHSASAGKE